MTQYEEVKYLSYCTQRYVISSDKLTREFWCKRQLSNFGGIFVFIWWFDKCDHSICICFMDIVGKEEMRAKRQL